MNCQAFSEVSSRALPEVLGLLNACGLPLAGVAEHLHSFVGLHDERRLVGVVGAEHYGELTLLRSLAVRPELRGAGLGGRLVQELLRRERLRGARRVFLLTTTAEDFFPRFGFAMLGRDAVPEAVRASREFRGACPATARAMAISLAC